jgi:hypothetical protein
MGILDGLFGGSFGWLSSQHDCSICNQQGINFCQIHSPQIQAYRQRNNQYFDVVNSNSSISDSVVIEGEYEDITDKRE